MHNLPQKLGFFLYIYVNEADKSAHVKMKSQSFINLQALKSINSTYSYMLTKKGKIIRLNVALT